MDIGMPLLNGLEAAAQMIRENANIGVIILSMHTDESYIVRALDAGARGYLLKDNADDDIERAIRSVAVGRPFFSPSIAQALVEDDVRLMRKRHVQDSYDLLTEREREVLQLLAEGKSNKEAATISNLSPYTIETHRQNLMQKLGAAQHRGNRAVRGPQGDHPGIVHQCCLSDRAKWNYRASTRVSMRHAGVRAGYTWRRINSCCCVATHFAREHAETKSLRMSACVPLGF